MKENFLNAKGDEAPAPIRAETRNAISNRIIEEFREVFEELAK